MEAEAKLFKSKAVSCKMDWNTETVILSFFGITGRILETQELFPKAHSSFTHEPTYMYAYLPLFKVS